MGPLLLLALCICVACVLLASLLVVCCLFVDGLLVSVGVVVFVRR